MSAPTLAVTADNWRCLATCREVDPEMFFNPKADAKAKAAAVCAHCPVRAHCLADVEAMPAHLRYTGQYRAGRWWAARNLGARALARRKTDADLMARHYPEETK